MREQCELDPTYVDVSKDKNYLSVDDLRADLLDLPIYFDWVAWRVGNTNMLIQPTTYQLAWIEIILLAAIPVYCQSRVAGYLNRAFGFFGDFR